MREVRKSLANDDLGVVANDIGLPGRSLPQVTHIKEARLRDDCRFAVAGFFAASGKRSLVAAGGLEPPTKGL